MALPRVTNSNEPSTHQLFKKGVIDWRQVLVFVNENKWKLRVCTAEQCGHVYLIVVVNEPFVGLLDATLKDGIDKVGGEVIREFFQSRVELGAGYESLRVGVEIIGDITQGFSKANSCKNIKVHSP